MGSTRAASGGTWVRSGLVRRATWTLVALLACAASPRALRLPDDAASTPPRLRVRGSIGNSLVTLWLHPTSFLVMKREVAFNRSQRLHVVEYTPVVDRPIPPGVFTQPLISDALKAITAVSVVGLGGLGACGLGLLWWSRRTRPVAIGG